jgi:hypothetical protein
MRMKVIALTSANEPAMQAVATQLLEAAHAGQLPLSVMVGVKSAQEAQAVFQGHGELWRIGHDGSKPDLDVLVDRIIPDGAADRMAIATARALRHFVSPQQQVGA